MIQIERLRDVLGDVVYRCGIPFDAHVVLGESVDVEESDFPDGTHGVPIAQILQLPEDLPSVLVGRIGTEGTALPMEKHLEGLIQMEDHMRGRISGHSGFLHNHLGITALYELFQTRKEPGDPFSLGRYEIVGLVTRHGLVVDRQCQEEQMRIGSIGSLERDLRVLQDLVQPLLLNLLPKSILRIAPAADRTRRMLAGIKVGEEVVILRFHILYDIWQKRVRIDFPGEDISL